MALWPNPASRVGLRNDTASLLPLLLDYRLEDAFHESEKIVILSKKRPRGHRSILVRQLNHVVVELFPISIKKHQMIDLWS